MHDQVGFLVYLHEEARGGEIVVESLVSSAWVNS